jgi:hypothetical protein
MRLKTGSLLVLLLVGVFCGRAEAALSANESPVLSLSGEITGVVTLCGTQGTDGTTLYLLGKSFSVRTGASGDFLFNYVPAGTYSLVIQVPGQAPVTQSVSVSSKESTNLGTIAICPDNDNDTYTALTDCNDNNPNIHPNANESCNGVDDNCNDIVDEGCVTCTDADGDGFKAQASCNTLVDCDDSNATIHPGATELCNGLDDNCNGTKDEGFNLATDPRNCGACGHACSFANASAACFSGTCQFVSCNAGFFNCDGLQANGCETQGSCSPICTNDSNCSQAEYCNANGTCVPDLLNGGACDRNSQCLSNICNLGFCSAH